MSVEAKFWLLDQWFILLQMKSTVYYKELCWYMLWNFSVCQVYLCIYGLMEMMLTKLKLTSIYLCIRDYKVLAGFYCMKCTLLFFLYDLFTIFFIQNVWLYCSCLDNKTKKNKNQKVKSLCHLWHKLCVYFVVTYHIQTPNTLSSFFIRTRFYNNISLIEKLQTIYQKKR